jgi:hypothetical protein
MAKISARHPWGGTVIRNLAIVVSTGILVALTLVRAAEPDSITLWPNSASEEPGGIGAETIRMPPALERKQTEVTVSTYMVTNVTQPTLTFFRTPKDIDTSTSIIICPD